jgi:hypothetical protein
VAADPGFAGIFEHDPLPREEAAVQAAGSRVWRAPPPRSAHGAEADVQPVRLAYQPPANSTFL